MSKFFNEQMVIEMLRRDMEAVERGILAIHRRQTPDEQENGETRWRNNVGFSAADAKKASKFVSWMRRQERFGVPAGQRFTGKFRQEALELAIKYRRQLVSIANENALAKMNQEDVYKDEPPTLRMIRVA